MSTIQERTIPVALTGSDILASVRSAVGRSLAFLLPALHRTITEPQSATSVLVLVATRHVARLTMNVVRSLLSFSDQHTARMASGGTKVRIDLELMEENRNPTVIVATPGRLLDHLTNESSGFKEALQQIKVLILDEADRLMEAPIVEEVEKILQHLPAPEQRQTMVFASNLRGDFKAFAALALRPNYEFMDFDEDQLATQKVAQSLLVTRLQDQSAALAVLLMQCMKLSDYKIVVFFTTARHTQFYAQLFEAMGRSVFVLHSRLSEAERENVCSAFREKQNVILFTSDMVTPNLQFAHVSSVIQVGLPIDRAQYMHRIEKTSHAEKGGSAVVLLAPFEKERFKTQVSGLSIQQIPKLPKDMMAAMQGAVEGSIKKVPLYVKVNGYRAYLGFYHSKAEVLGKPREEMVKIAAEWALQVAMLSEIPSISKRSAMLMGIDERLVNIAPEYPRRGRFRGRGRGFVHRGRGGHRGQSREDTAR
ncbi:unnamed protein product [Agarophyton chilense]